MATHLPGYLGRDHLGLGGHQGLTHLPGPLVASLLGYLHWASDRDIGALLHGDVDTLLALDLQTTPGVNILSSSNNVGVGVGKIRPNLGKKCLLRRKTKILVKQSLISGLQCMCIYMLEIIIIVGVF